MIKKQCVKNEQMKRKQTCSLCFENVFKFQDSSKKSLGNKILIIRKFLGKANGRNYYYMINMDGQRLKIDHWPALICSAKVHYKAI